MYKLILVLPKDIKSLQKKYTEALADAVAGELTHEELGCLISELKKTDDK